jgi:excisionase family DNA binding protein
MNTGEDSAPAREPLITVREVAERLGVRRTWVLRRVRSGDLPGFRLGGDGCERSSKTSARDHRKREHCGRSSVCLRILA